MDYYTMGKSKRDYRRNSAANVDSYSYAETKPHKSYDRQNFGNVIDRGGAGDDYNTRRQRPPRQPRERVADPVALEIAKVFAEQIKTFLAAPVEERAGAANALFRLDERPMQLDLGQDENTDAVKFYVYDVDRSVRVDRTTPEKLRHMSAAFVVNSTDSIAPAYYVNAHIFSEDGWNVRVIPQGDRGPEYRSSATIDSRDEKPVDSEQ